MPARIHRNLAWSYINWATAMAAPLVMIPIYLRCLGHPTYGAWLVILSLTTYLSLANLGVGQTLNNRIAEAVARGREGEIGPLVSTAFFSYAAIAAALTAAMIGLTPLLAARLALGASLNVVVPFFIYTSLVLLSFPFKVFPMVLRGFERVDADQAITAGSSIMRIAAIAIALLAGYRLMAVAWINGGAEIALPLAAFWQARRLTPHARPKIALFSRALLTGMVRPSLAFFGIQVGNTLIAGVDNLVIGYALGAAAVTAYAVPYRLVGMLIGLFGVAVGAFNPTVTVNYAQGSHAALARGYIMSLRLSMLYGTAGVIALWVAGPQFIRVWAGSGVFPGTAPYALMLAMFMIAVWATPASSILWATTRHYTWCLMSVGEGALNLALSLWWVRRFGLSGVIGATCVASLLLTGWYLPYAAFRTLGISIRRVLAELLPGIALSATALAAVAMLWNFHAPVSLAHAIAWGAAAIAAYGCAFFWIGFSRAERRIAIGLLSAQRRQPMAA